MVHTLVLEMVLQLTVAGAGHEFDAECGTVLTPEGADVYAMLLDIALQRMPEEVRYSLDVPLAIHVVRQSNGQGGLNTANLPVIIAEANSFWAPIGIQFFQQGPVDFINDNNFYFNIDTQAEIDQLRQTNVVPNAVNVYFTFSLATNNGATPLCGISSFTWSSVQGIVMKNSCSEPGDTTLPHEIGHYFNLLHTHETAYCLECPDGLNCSDCGDLLCDTPADPNLSGMVASNCSYIGTVTVCNGQVYQPDTTQMMSYSLEECRNHFSDQQESLALATLIGQRPTLISAPGLGVTWVDFGGSNGNGSYSSPFNNLASALQATAPEGTIVFKPGSTAETRTINQAVTLDSFRGTVTIGQ